MESHSRNYVTECGGVFTASYKDILILVLRLRAREAKDFWEHAFYVERMQEQGRKQE